MVSSSRFCVTFTFLTLSNGLIDLSSILIPLQILLAALRFSSLFFLLPSPSHLRLQRFTWTLPLFRSPSLTSLGLCGSCDPRNRVSFSAEMEFGGCFCLFVSVLFGCCETKGRRIGEKNIIKRFWNLGASDSIRHRVITIWSISDMEVIFEDHRNGRDRISFFLLCFAVSEQPNGASHRLLLLIFFSVLFFHPFDLKANQMKKKRRQSLSLRFCLLAQEKVDYLRPEVQLLGILVFVFLPFLAKQADILMRI